MNSAASEFPVEGITSLVNTVLVLLKAGTTYFPSAKLHGLLPRGVFSVWPPFSEALQAHTVFPPSLFLFLFLGEPFLNKRVQSLGRMNGCFLDGAHGIYPLVSRSVCQCQRFPDTKGNNYSDLRRLHGTLISRSPCGVSFYVQADIGRSHICRCEPDRFDPRLGAELV